MKKAFPIALIVLGVVFGAAGLYTVYRGLDAKDQVREELQAQNIVTPGDARIPNTQVKDIDTAQAMADIIQVHAMEATGGLTYAEMDRDDPARGTALNAANLRTSLYTSVMAFEVGNLVIGLGLMIVVMGVAVGGLGVAMASLVIPTLAEKVHVHPVVEDEE
ncbi:MAG: hypothetical protein U5K29_08540 [Acidimicrobiales bacterium]|nr:hypothetical protein [Acidimicrobiales bacterium]